MAAGVELLGEANNNGGASVSNSTLFVLTDDTPDLQHEAALRYAAAEGVDVVQVVVGTVPTSPKRAFSRFIEVQSPVELPKALDMYFERFQLPQQRSQPAPVGRTEFHHSESTKQDAQAKATGALRRGSPFKRQVADRAALHN